MSRRLERFWYNGSKLQWLLFPLQLLLLLLVQFRRWLYKLGVKQQRRIETTVWVVGNITVGGTGKTPFITWLASYLKSQQVNLVIVSRGYGGKSQDYPLEVTSQISAQQCGDEPKMLFDRLGIPVIVDPNRSRAVALATERYKPDIIISDDGLQHYAMGRDLEFCIVDAMRGFGNRLLMPLGPLREPVGRIKSCDYVVLNGHNDQLAHYSNAAFSIAPLELINVRSGESIAINPSSKLPFVDCYAICGIGNPSRFRQTLDKLQFDYQMREFTDHYQYTASDFTDLQDRAIIMTEKDAVKCRSFAGENWWFLKVGCVPDKRLQKAVDDSLKKLKCHIGSQDEKSNI